MGPTSEPKPTPEPNPQIDIKLYCMQCFMRDDSNVQMQIYGNLIASPNNSTQTQEYKCPSCFNLIQLVLNIDMGP